MSDRIATILEKLIDRIIRERNEVIAENEKLRAELGELWEDICNYQVELASRDDIIKKLKEDAERLASTFVIEAYPNEFVCRSGCHHWSNKPDNIQHPLDCPIAMHRALMKELEC